MYHFDTISTFNLQGSYRAPDHTCQPMKDSVSMGIIEELAVHFLGHSTIQVIAFHGPIVHSAAVQT